MSSHKYRDLKVWQKAMTFTLEIYRESARSFPADERFGLISQIRRATTAIPLNIAEGSGNQSNKEFCRFLEIAQRSGYEVMTAIDIARGLGYWSDAIADRLLSDVDEISVMLTGLSKTLQSRG